MCNTWLLHAEPRAIDIIGMPAALALSNTLHNALASIGEIRMPSTPLAIRSLTPSICLATSEFAVTTLTS